jgi:hypothetical protein
MNSITTKMNNSTGMNSELDNVNFEFNNINLSNEKLKLRVPQVSLGFDVLLTREYIGENNPLGEKLMRDFIFSITQNLDLPQYIIFMNSAVKLIASDEECINNIKKLKKYGTVSVVSIESLEYFGLIHECKSGLKEVSADIMEKIIVAKKIVKF